MKKITLTEAIRYRSQDYAVGAVLDLSEFDANQLVASGHAEPVADKPAGKTLKTTSDQE